MGAGQPSDDPVAQVVADALSEISDVALTVEVTGTLDSHKMRFSSDADDKLGQALKNVVRKQAKQFEEQMREALREKVGQQQEALTRDLDAFGPMLTDIAERLGLARDALGAKSLLPF